MPLYKPLKRVIFTHLWYAIVFPSKSQNSFSTIPPPFPHLIPVPAYFHPGQSILYQSFMVNCAKRQAIRNFTRTSLRFHFICAASNATVVSSWRILSHISRTGSYKRVIHFCGITGALFTDLLEIKTQLVSNFFLILSVKCASSICCARVLMSFLCRLPGRSAVHRNRLQRGIRSFLHWRLSAAPCCWAKLGIVYCQNPSPCNRQNGISGRYCEAVAQNVPVNCAEVRRFPIHNEKAWMSIQVSR